MDHVSRSDSAIQLSQLNHGTNHKIDGVSETNEVDLDPVLALTNDHDQCAQDDDFVYINVSGGKFLTTYTCLNKCPNTLLGDKERRKQYWSETLQAYYFNQHKPCFDSILYYYQTGIEAPPGNVNPDVYAKEKEFFGLKKEKEVVVVIPEGDCIKINCMNSHRMKIHNLLMDPSSSRFAFFWHSVDIIFISLSICFLVLESEKSLMPHFTSKKAAYFWPIFITNCVIMAFFTLDFMIRLLTWPSLISFWKNLFNVLDILSIMPFYLGLMLNGVGNGDLEPQTGDSDKYVVLRVCRIFRIVRVFKFVRHSQDLLIIMKAVSIAKRELMLLVCLLFIFVITFGSIMYYIESGANPQYSSIMASCWWVIVTITTVGYGDMSPISPGGKIFGALVLTVGIVFLALPMTIIISKFRFVYEREKN